MAGSLIEHEQIKTTLPKAKELRPIVEKLITWASAAICTPAVRPRPSLKEDQDVAKLFEVLGPRYKDRQGGYVRVPEGWLPLWRHGSDGDHRIR